jgi:1,4-dihydroxy-2-naphthoyl-CoA hydrolase
MEGGRPGLRVKGRFDVAKHHMAPNGFLHAASVIALADSACGYGCMISLPEGASQLHDHRAEVELPGHGPRRRRARPARPSWSTAAATQVWDAVVTAERPARPSRFSAAPRWFCYPKA